MNFKQEGRGKRTSVSQVSSSFYTSALGLEAGRKRRAFQTSEQSGQDTEQRPPVRPVLTALFGYTVIAQLVTPSLPQLVTSSLPQLVTPSLQHFITSSLQHLVTSSLPQLVKPSPPQSVTSPLQQSLTSPLRQSVASYPSPVPDRLVLFSLPHLTSYRQYHD